MLYLPKQPLLIIEVAEFINRKKKKMADFIKVTHRMSITVSPYETDVERWISKYQITHMEDDRAHNQSLIIHNGQEMYIRETIDQVIAAFQE